MNRLYLALAAALAVAACEQKKPTETLPASSAASAAPSAAPKDGLPAFDPVALNPFAPIPEGVEHPVIDEAVKLGRMLYFDPRLSAGNDVSCASCHDLEKAGADRAALSTGTKKQTTKRNAPSVLNAGGSFAQGWDARSTTLEEFVLAHVLDASIMGMADEKRVVSALGTVPGAPAAFKKAFPDEAMSGDTFGRALGGYVKKLFARSRWDRYLAGDKSLLTPAELTGVAMFVEAGCITCHQGKYLGATQSQKLGIAKPWPALATPDDGRFEVTKQEADRGLFKVPTLRNVKRTGPWLHDGSLASLEETVRLMARHQIGRELTDAQVNAIVAFLGTLDGDPPKELTAKPQPPGKGG